MPGIGGKYGDANDANFVIFSIMLLLLVSGSVNSNLSMCAMVKSRYIGDGHPTFNMNPYNGAL